MYPLADIVSEICTRAGLPASLHDVSALSGNVIGFSADNTKPAFSFLRALSDIYFFDPVMRDGIVHFVHRGSASVRDINEDDLLVDSEDTIQRYDNAAIPRIMHLTYFDIDGGIDPNKQTSDRSISVRGEGEVTAATTVVLDADTALQAITIVHKVAADAARGRRIIKLPREYIELTVADIVTFDSERMRIVQVDIDDGFQTYELAFERGSAVYESVISGIAPPALPDPDAFSPGLTHPEFIDIPILNDTDEGAGLGFYFAVSGEREAWDGAFVELSVDGGVNYSEYQTSNVDTIIGVLATSLPIHSAFYPDDVNTVRVNIATIDVDISSVTLGEMCNRENRAMIGDELVNLGNATEISEGVWDFDYLLRGRLGTVPITHAVDTRFVLLIPDRIAYNTTESYNLNQTLYFRITSVNSSTQTIISHTLTGSSHTERAPANLRAYRSGGDIIINWIGVGRRGGRGQVEMGSSFTNYLVTINDSGTHNETAQTKTITDPGGLVNIKVQQVNSITGAGDTAEIEI